MTDMTDQAYMGLAIEEARKGDAPYGAVLVKGSEIVVRAYNTVTSDGDVTAHAEINVLRKALVERSIDSLEGYTLYTTGEPCAMCTGAIIFAGVGRVVYGASVQELAAAGQDQIHISSETIIAAGFQNIEVEGGVRVAEVLRLFEI